MTFMNRDSDSYVFGRDHKSAIRLNYQHSWTTQLSGYLIHPTIPVHNPNIRVADVGAGTCIWSLDLAKQLPKTVRFDSFDISAAQYPVREWLPSNVHPHTHDAFETFPQKHLGTYDVVYIRFLITLVNSENVTTLVRNVMDLLSEAAFSPLEPQKSYQSTEPGGHLQWFEVNPLSIRAKAVHASVSTTAAERLAALIRKPGPDADCSWVPELCTTTSSLGLQTITCDVIPLTDEYRTFWNHSNLLAMEDFATKMKGEKSTEMKALMTTIGEEFAQGVSLDTEWFCYVGMKPL